MEFTDMTKEQALDNFWRSFGMTAYDETNVPEDAPFPRLTYEVALDNFGGEVALTATLWYYSTTWKDISEKAQEIADDITRGGKIIATDGGAIWIKRGNPFAQRMPDNNDSLRRIVLNITAEYLTSN